MKARKRPMWVCGSCGHGTNHTTKTAAELCCVCPSCKAPNPTQGGGRVYCATCTAKSALASERRRLMSAIANFAFVVRETQEAGVDYNVIEELPF